MRSFRADENSRQSLSQAETWEPLQFAGQEVAFDGPVSMTYELVGQPDSIWLQGEVEARVVLRCARCSEDFVLPLKLPVEDVISLRADDDPEEQWQSSYLSCENDELDLSEYSLLAVLEEIPMKPLCTADCKGLCPVCGHNRNLGDCGCEDDQIDPRLAVLKKLLK
ncbi:MAG: YceD family protein [Bacillota bacterium]